MTINKTDFSTKIFLTDKADFHLDSFVIPQNGCFCSSEKLRGIVEKKNTQRFTLWWRFWAGGMIGSYLSQAVIVTSA